MNESEPQEVIAYGLRTRAGHEWVVCGKCAAFVSDAVTHSEWHRNYVQVPF